MSLQLSHCFSAHVLFLYSLRARAGSGSGRRPHVLHLWGGFVSPDVWGSGHTGPAGGDAGPVRHTAVPHGWSQNRRAVGRIWRSVCDNSLLIVYFNSGGLSVLEKAVLCITPQYCTIATVVFNIIVLKYIKIIKYCRIIDNCTFFSFCKWDVIERLPKVSPKCIQNII